MFSEQWKSALFAGIAFVLVGICYVAVAQSSPENHVHGAPSKVRVSLK